MKLIKNICLYVLTFYFILQGAFGLSISPISSVFFWVCAILTAPVIHDLITKSMKEKGKSPIKSWMYFVFVLVLFSLGWMFWPTFEKQDDASTGSNVVIENSNNIEDIKEETDSKKDTDDIDLSDIEANKSDQSNEEIINDGIIDKLVEFGFTEDEAEEMRKLFIMCGVNSIDECKPTDSNSSIDGIASFRAEWDKDRVFWFTVEKRKVFYMSLNGTDVYDVDKGGFLINVNDVHVPETSLSQSQKIELRDFTEKVLDKYFKYTPYYDAFGFARSDDDYMVQCEAYAKNDLGTSRYVPVKVWYEKDGDNYTVTGVKIDGIQYEIK